MRRKKWLLVIVLIVFIINITFFVLVRSSYLNDTVQARISDYLEKNMDVQVEFGSFTFNDKQLKITDLSFSRKADLEVKVDQVYVEYNLVKLLLTRFKDLHAIQEIKIFQPELNYRIQPDHEKKQKSRFEIPDISQYFKRLQIFDGTFSIEYESGDLLIAKKLQNIELNILNTKQTSLELSAGSRQNSISAGILLLEGEILLADLQISDFRLDSLLVPELNQPTATLNMNLNYQPRDLQFEGNLSKLSAEYDKKLLTAEKLNFQGSDSEIECDFIDLQIDENKFLVEASILNYATADRAIAAEISANRFPLSRYLPVVNGFVDVNATIAGNLQNPVIEAEATAPMIQAFGQQIKDTQLTAVIKNNKLKWRVQKAYWQDNLLMGTGEYEFGQEMILDLNAPEFFLETGNYSLNCALTANLKFHDQLEINLSSQNLDFLIDTVQLNDFELQAELFDTRFNALLQNKTGNIIFNAFGDLADMDVQSNLRLKRLDLSHYLSDRSLPIISGTIEAELQNDLLEIKSMLNAFDRDFGKLSGRVGTAIDLDLKRQQSSVKLDTYNAKYNYEPFSLKLRAAGSFDSLHIQQLNLNNDLSTSAYLKLKPEFSYDLKINAEEVKLREFAKYFTNYSFYNDLKGNASFEMQASNLGQGNIAGRLEVFDFTLGDLLPLNGIVEFSGDAESLLLKNSYLCCGEEKMIELASQVTFLPQFKIDLTGTLHEINVENIFGKDDLEGWINGKFNFYKSFESQKLDVEIFARDLGSKDLRVDAVELSFSQMDSLLILHKLAAKRKGMFNMTSSGALGYNILNSISYADTNTINIHFEGDLLALLAANSTQFRSGSSECDFLLNFGLQENNIFLKNGYFNLNKGALTIKDQPAPMDKIQIEMLAENNELTLDKFKFDVGEGRVYISNRITATERDFRLGSMNFGQFLVRTNKSGIPIFISGYNPQNSFINAIIIGRNTDHLEINGPFDDMLIVGDVIFFNGDLVYPPHTENLLKLFSTVTAEKKTEEATVLPLSFDLKLKLGENVRYVTYPIDIKLKEDGFIHLRYQNEEFLSPDGLFVADEGSIDMFGTTLLLDFLQVELSQFRQGVSIRGLFFKKTADGTLITLELFNDETGTSNLGNLRFELKSDNPADLIIDILAKLRYNRSMDEISPAQKQSLLQDEVIQIAGLGLESAVLDPLISPVENTIRKWLRLDYFHLQTDLIQNLFSTYSSEEKSELTYREEQTEVDRFTSVLFLNNLSVSAGKYLTRKVFFDYEVRFEKEDDIAAKTYLGVFQHFTLRYDLPWKLRLSYRFSLLPFDEENEHQIGIERSFRF